MVRRGFSVTTKKTQRMNNNDSLFTGYNKGNIDNARNLRKNMTRQEKHLWFDFLRDYPVKIYRQRNIGKYIVDFYCSKAKLAIEIDGEQHYERKAIIDDQVRSDEIGLFDVKVIRYTNADIDKNFDAVCVDIDAKIKRRIGTQ